MDELLRAIDAALKKKGLSDAAASNLAVGNPSLIKNLRNSRKQRERAHPFENLQALAEVLDLDFYIGPRRPQTGPRGFAEAAEPLIRPTLDGQVEALHQGYLPIPWHRADLRHRDLSHLAIAAAWIEEQELDLDNLFAISMPDDAMAPQIQPDEVLLLDTTFTPEPSPTLCAVSEAGRLRIGWVILPKAGAWVQFYARAFTPPLVHQAKKGATAEFLGRIVGRFDTRPAPRLSIEESHRLHEVADGLLKGR